MNKFAYDTVARTINSRLKQIEGEGLKPRVTVVNTENMGYGFNKWSLALNDDLYDLVQHKGIAQDLFYADEVYTVTEPNGTDYDLYLEPVTRTYFDICKL